MANNCIKLLLTVSCVLSYHDGSFLVRGLPLDSQSVPASDPTNKGALLKTPKTVADSKTPDETDSSNEHTTAGTDTGHWHIHDHTVYTPNPEATKTDKPATEGCYTFTVTMTIPPPIQAILIKEKDPLEEKNLTDNEIPTGLESADALI